MAYRDANGNITIDENEAYRDISRLQNVYDVLKDADYRLQHILITATESRGLIANSIEGTAASLRREIQALQNGIQDQIRRIRVTVRKYQEVDAKLKETIASGGGFR